MALSGSRVPWALLLLLLLLPGSGMAGTDAVNQINQKDTVNSSGMKASAPSVRVRTDVQSFHLDRRASTAPNQIGAASRGSHTTLVLCAPNSGLASTARPVFVWQLSSTSTGPVHFSLVNPAGEVLFETEVTGTHLAYPREAPVLTPGESFAWTVSGHGGTDKLPTYVQFEVQGKADRDEITKELAGVSADPLARAQVLLSHQVWYDAIEELENGLRLSPGRQDLNQQLQELYRLIAPACAHL